MIKYLIIILIAFGVTEANYSDVIKGKVIDQNGNPLQTPIIFESEDGKITKISSNSEGFYSGAIQDGKSYTVIIKGSTINDGQNIVTMPNNDKYDEITHNIQVFAFVPGTEIMQIDFFKSNSAELNRDAKLSFKSIYKHYINHHKKLKLILSDDDCNNNNILEEREKVVLQMLFKYNMRNKMVEAVKVRKKGLSDGKDALLEIY